MAPGQNHDIILLLLFCTSHPIWGLSLRGSALREHLMLASVQQVHGRHPGQASIPLLVTTWPLSLPTLLHPSILNVVVSDSVQVQSGSPYPLLNTSSPPAAPTEAQNGPMGSGPIVSAPSLWPPRTALFCTGIPGVLRLPAWSRLRISAFAGVLM